jgi:hypothetical protein
MNNLPPIWYPHEIFYLESMHFLTGSTMISADFLAKAVFTLKHRQGTIIIDDVLDHLQNIVHQAGALSRYFWPTLEPYRSRGKYLRSIFEVTETSPLKSRDVRNRLEHFDEKLDDYLKRKNTGEFFPSYVGPCPPDDGMPRHFFRAYYLDVGIFEILGVQIKMQPLVDEIMRIHNLLVEYSENGSRFPLQDETAK